MKVLEKYDNYFRSSSRFMNDKRAYFNFKVQAMNINSNIPFALSAKLHKITKYFHCGTEIWDKIINSK